MNHPAILPPGTPVILSRVKRPEFQGKRGVIVRYIKRHRAYRVRTTEPIVTDWMGTPHTLPDGVTYDADPESLDVES